MTKCTFSNDDITGAFPRFSRRVTKADWELLDTQGDDGLETLSTSPGSIFPQKEDKIREEVPKKGKKFWEGEGRMRNKGLEQNEDQDKRSAQEGNEA